MKGSCDLDWVIAKTEEGRVEFCLSVGYTTQVTCETSHYIYTGLFSLLKPPSYYAVFLDKELGTQQLLTCIPGGEGTGNYSLSCLMLQVPGLELRSNKYPVA